MFRIAMLALATLVLLPLFPLSAQDRCVRNLHSIRGPAELERELAERREELFFATQPDHISFVTQRISWLEQRLKPDARVGLGNGWIADAPNSCILYISASNEPVMGTRIYFIDSIAELPVPSVASQQRAVVTDGPARIRSGPGLEHPRVSWCAQGLGLTIWPPAVDGWLRASCYGANGWIYEPLVRYEAGPGQPAVAPVAPGDGGRPASGQQATVIDGPARIRSGPGQQHARLAWCATGASLTVFPPATEDWLPASCYGANGWIYEPLVTYEAASAQPAVAPVLPGDGARPASGQQATVTSGPAAIRNGPGQQHARLAWCANAAPLTVFPPATEGWLPASCYGANGWIYEPLVTFDAAPAQPAVAPVAPGDSARPASGQQATVTSGPAHIRSGPGQEHLHLRWCGIGWSLTVFPPAVEGWLPASCYGANGWIHESLVSVSD